MYLRNLFSVLCCARYFGWVQTGRLVAARIGKSRHAHHVQLTPPRIIHKKRGTRNKVNIVGECVLRDTLGFHEGNGGYECPLFVQSNSVRARYARPLSSFAGVRITHDDMPSSPPVWARWADIDAEKTIALNLKKNPSDYLLVNFVEARYTLLRVSLKSNPADYTLMTSQAGINRNDLFGQDKYQALSVVRIGASTVPEEEFRDCVHRFAEEVSELYAESRVVLFKNGPVPRYLAGGGDIVSFTGESEMGAQLVEKCNQWFLSKMPGCHVVDMPRHLLADECHRWGLGVTHYQSEYYDYALQALNVVTDNHLLRKIRLKGLLLAYEVYFRRNAERMAESELGGASKPMPS